MPIQLDRGTHVQRDVAYKPENRDNVISRLLFYVMVLEQTVGQTRPAVGYACFSCCVVLSLSSYSVFDKMVSC